jgi:cytochrome b6-f complex iron-sulfur subunit
MDHGGDSAASQERLVDAGPVTNFASNGVYNAFRNQGFFVIRNSEELFALSAICTHKKCKLAAEPDHSFYCACHGSTFDSGGRVTRGPAKRDLPVLSAFANESGHLLVKAPAL